MDGGITRQSEQYGIFEDRPRPERVAREAPQEVIREYTRGPSVGAGQLNPRNIRRQHFAVNTRGMDPEEHAYHGEAPYGPTGIGNERRHYNPYSGYEPTDRDERASEMVGEDDDSGYNWGPEPKHDDPYGGHAPETPLIPLDQMLEEHNRPLPPEPGSRLGFNRVGQGLMTHMFTPGSQVGLPYGNEVIRGIVHQLHPDSEVGVRWEDGQYTKESPGDVYPL